MLLCTATDWGREMDGWIGWASWTSPDGITTKGPQQSRILWVVFDPHTHQKAFGVGFSWVDRSLL